jgi:hypothetical protein
MWLRRSLATLKLCKWLKHSRETELNGWVLFTALDSLSSLAEFRTAEYAVASNLSWPSKLFW